MNVALVVDGIIALVVLELAVLGGYYLLRRRGMPFPELLSFLGAGLGLLVALRVLIANGSITLFVSALFVSLVLHVWHVRQRWE